MKIELGMKYAALFILLFVGSAIAGEKRTARESVDLWLKQMDELNYEQTWKQAAPLFQQAVSVESWSSAASKVRGPLGELVSRELLSAIYASELPGVPSGDYVVFQFKTSFQDKKGVIETVTPMLVDGCWRVSGYFVK